jgi:hypothetical protein
MDSKIEQHGCLKICMKLGKSATETLEMLHEAFGEHSLSQTVVFEWHSLFNAGQVSAEDDNCSGQPSTSETTEMFKKFKNSSMKTVGEQSMSSQTLLGSFMEFARS